MLAVKRASGCLVAALVFFISAVKADAGSEKPASDAMLANEVSVSGAYINVPLPGTQSTAAYFTLRNTSASDIALIAVHSDVAERIELHSHIHADGMMKMRRVEQVVIPAQSTVMFKSGAYHVMMFDLQASIRTGQQVDLVLEFSNGKKLLAVAQVKSLFDAPHAH